MAGLDALGRAEYGEAKPGWPSRPSWGSLPTWGRSRKRRADPKPPGSCFVPDVRWGRFPGKYILSFYQEPPALAAIAGKAAPPVFPAGIRWPVRGWESPHFGKL